MPRPRPRLADPNTAPTRNELLDAIERLERRKRLMGIPRTYAERMDPDHPYNKIQARKDALTELLVRLYGPTHVRGIR